VEKKLTCIECPQGCGLTVELENGFMVKVAGNKCPKGEAYAKQEIENPLRTLTTTVLAQGLALKMVPVRTSRPIPKSRLLDAMAAVRSLRVSQPVKMHEVLAADFLGLNVDLIATRAVGAADGVS
jgi:CxxC motif-containing protein